ncbi:MAG: ABC transporter permease [Proteobacteria bacterium]|nr:ABC transporter permease [Pseudomonadota bacterium]
MILHYLRSQMRGAARNKQYFAINILGLAVALATVILIGLFVRDELSYDKWLSDADRLYKVETTINTPGQESVKSSFTPGTLAPALGDYFNEEIEAATRVYRNNTTVRTADRQFNEALTYVDASFFELFDLPIAEGSGELALANSNNIMISETVGRKYFGDQSPVGQILNIDHPPSGSKIDYQVVGVFKDLPINTHMEFSFIALLDPPRYVNWPWVTEDWTSATVDTYFKLRPGLTIEAFEAKFPDFVRSLPLAGKDEEDVPPRFVFSFLNVTDIHLYSDATPMVKPSGGIATVNSFSVIALLILAMASINFTNLASAQAIKRAREVSVRKVLGANRRQIAMQFLGESIVTTMVAMLLGIAIVELLLPFYNEFLGKEIALQFFTNPVEALTLLLFAVAVGIAGGAYPAFVLSSFRPAKTLQSNQSRGSGSPRVRQVLVVVQFTISTALIISTLIIYAQMLFSQSVDPGFARENRLTLSGTGFNQVAPVSTVLKRELLNIPGVRSVGLSSDTFPQKYNNSIPLAMPGQNQTETMNIRHTLVGVDFLTTYEISPIAGRVFSEAFQGDFGSVPEDTNLPITRAAVINKSLAKLAGFEMPDQAIGQQLTIPASARNPRLVAINIVGVINDLHTGTTRQSPVPMIYLLTQSGLDFVTIELDESSNGSVIEQIEEVWSKLSPSVPIVMTFAEDAFGSLYRVDNDRATIFAIFAALAILISSIGIYGLAAFVAKSRTLEIGIRKVHGASVFDIVKLLLLQFSWPILAANFIAWPVAYFYMEDWLTAFVYRIDVSLAYFLFAGLLTLIIGWGVGAAHAIQAAQASPIKAIRAE